MLTINKVFPEKTIPEKTDSFLFFDIETTGFSKDNTILYLIGCGYFIENGFQFIRGPWAANSVRQNRHTGHRNV